MRSILPSSSSFGLSTRHKSCGCDNDDEEFDMADSFTHTPELGYIRECAVPSVVLPNERIDQFVWRNLQQWQDKTAMVAYIHM